MARVIVAANSTWNLQNFRIGLIRALLHQGHEVTTVSPDAEGVTINKSAIPHRRCDMSRNISPLKDIGYARALFRLMKQEKPDIFLGFTIKPNIYGCVSSRMAGVQAIPNISGLGATFLGGSITMRIVVLLYRLALSRAAIVFFQNRDDQSLFVAERIVRLNQSEVLPGSGIDLVRFSQSDLSSDLRFLMIARLLGDKGVREYVNAARRLRARIPSAKFLLLGELDRYNPARISRHELDEWVREGVVEYVGSATDVRPHIRNASAVVLPSYREGLPRALLEAAAMGRPLIGTDVPGCREVVREGITGFLCQPRDANSLAAAMERFANIPHQRRILMATNARRMAETEFDQARVFEAYLTAIRRTVGVSV